MLRVIMPAVDIAIADKEFAPRPMNGRGAVATVD